MALPCRFSQICTLLLWGCISFPPQKGYNIAHGYSLDEDEFSRHAGVLGPQTSNQFNSGANTSLDSVSPRGEMQALQHQSYLQRKPVHRENTEEAFSVTNRNEEDAQSKPDSEQDMPSTPPVMRSDRGGSANQHPFGLLVKEHTRDKNTEDTSFSSIKDFKRFIETLKRSYLVPGSDLGGHFQTAKQIMENEIASNAENIKGERDMGHRSNSENAGAANDGASENEVGSEAMNAAFERGDKGANYQMPSQDVSFPDPVDSTPSLISSSVYDQDADLGSAFYPRHQSATEHVPSNYGSFDSGGILRENLNSFTSAPHVRLEAFQSISYELPEQTPSGSFLPEDLSLVSHVTAPPVNPPNGPSQDFNDYSSNTLISENIQQQPKYTFFSKDSLTGYQKPSSGFGLGNNYQSEELSSVNDLSPQMPTSLNSYGKHKYVGAPRGQFYAEDHLPKHRERPAQAFQPHQPTVGKQPKDINHASITYLPLSIDSLSSNSDSPSPQSITGEVGVQTKSPHDAQNQAFNRTLPVGFNMMFTVKPFSSLQSSSGHDGHLQDQKVGISSPLVLTAQAKNENSDLSKQNKVFASTKTKKQMPDNTPIAISGGLDSTKSGISSQVGVGDLNFNSLTNLAPTSALEKALFRLAGNGVMSRNIGIKNIISDTRGARNPLGFFPTPLRRSISLNGDYMSAIRAGLQQTFTQPTKVWIHQANMNKEPGNRVYWPPKLLSATKGSASNPSGVFWRNGGDPQKFLSHKGPSKLPSVNAYLVKSKNSYVRGKASLSKTRSVPYLRDEDNNTVKVNNVKGFQEP